MWQTFAIVELITSSMVGFLVTSTCAQCYLEDVSALCAVCWTDGKPSSGAECPPGVELSLDLTKQLYEKTRYPTDYRIKMSRTSFPIEADEGHEVIHANIHACVSKFGACTPFVSNTPGLSTHTPALKGNLSGTNFPANSSHVSIETYTLEATFTSDVDLVIDDYMVIAHVRFYTRDSNQTRTRWDVAVGSPRKVEEAPVEISTDSIIAVAGVGILLIIFVGSCLYGVRSGKVDLETIIVTVTRPEVSSAADVTLAVFDAMAFTACIIEEVFPVNKLQHIVPVCVLLLVVVWLGACYEVVVIYLFFRDVCLERFSPAYFVKARLQKAAKAAGLDLEAVNERRQEALEQYAAERSFMQREKSVAAASIITLFLIDLPCASVSTYILFEIGSNTFVVLSLIFSMLLFGSKASSVTAVARNKKMIDAATHEIKIEVERVSLTRTSIGKESIALESATIESIASSTCIPTYVVRETSVETECTGITYVSVSTDGVWSL